MHWNPIRKIWSIVESSSEVFASTKLTAFRPIHKIRTIVGVTSEIFSPAKSIALWPIRKVSAMFGRKLPFVPFPLNLLPIDKMLPLLKLNFVQKIFAMLGLKFPFPFNLISVNKLLNIIIRLPIQKIFTVAEAFLRISSFVKSLALWPIQKTRTTLKTLLEIFSAVKSIVLWPFKKIAIGLQMLFIRPIDCILNILIDRGILQTKIILTASIFMAILAVVVNLFLPKENSLNLYTVYRFTLFFFTVYELLVFLRNIFSYYNMLPKFLKKLLHPLLKKGLKANLYDIVISGVLLVVLVVLNIIAIGGIAHFSYLLFLKTTFLG